MVVSLPNTMLKMVCRGQVSSNQVAVSSVDEIHRHGYVALKHWQSRCGW